MKRIGALLILILLNLNFAYAAETNKLGEFAKSPLITGLYVKAVSGKIRYESVMTPETPQGIDEHTSPNGIGDAGFRYKFVQNKPLKVYYQDFNPLEVSVKLDSKDEKTDLNDTNSFFQVLAGYKPIFAPALMTGQIAAAKGAIPPGEGLLPQEPEVEGKQLKGKVKINAAPTPIVEVNDTECDVLIENYGKLVNAYNNIKTKDEYLMPDENITTASLDELSVDEKKLNIWASKTTSPAGIDSVKNSIKEVTDKLDENVKNIKISIDNIVKTKNEGVCYFLPVVVVAQTSFVMSKAHEAVNHRETSSKNLKELYNYLSKYNKNIMSWNGSNYLIGTVQEPAKQNIKKATITVREIKFTASEDNVIINESDKNVLSNAFTVYKNENVMYEPSFGFVYSPLKSNTFSTKTVNGNQVIEKIENSDNYHAAAFLNVYYTEWINENVYPFWQLGLSTAKDYPALLTGLGMKIRDTSFAISVGAAFGFTKELNKLSEGATVTGQADIDKDVEIVVTPSWYLSLQYNFE